MFYNYHLEGHFGVNEEKQNLSVTDLAFGFNTKSINFKLIFTHNISDEVLFNAFVKI